MTSKSSKSQIRSKEAPEIIKDTARGFVYQRLKLLGKGGFAKCYEYKKIGSDEIIAGKVVPNEMLKSDAQKEKMIQEVQIQSSLNHINVVKLYSSFHDSENVYVLLELCTRRSLMELHRRRHSLLEPEVRYYMKQIIQGVDYLHKNRVIHRDLKLGNIFLSEEMIVKIGDFGLATTLQSNEEQKKTMCGTPNYIAPEILNKAGHSFAVDAWSVGCIVYTLLVGKPPFETEHLKETYKKIRKCEYLLPPSLSDFSKNFVSRLLVLNPEARPRMSELLIDPFFVKCFIPSGLPVSALEIQPRFDHIPNALYHYLSGQQVCSPVLMENNFITGGGDNMKRSWVNDTLEPIELDRHSLASLSQQLKFLLSKSNSRRDINSNSPPKPRPQNMAALEDCEHPASVPIFWVSKWVDYSDKYGLGYQLCDNSAGVLFNDYSRLLISADGQNVQFIEKDGREMLYTIENVPQELQKKMRLMANFKSYMEEFLVKAGENQERREIADMVRLPYMKSWIRNQSVITMHLSNGTVQINFFQDHAKLIMCPIMSAVTYIDVDKNFKTYSFDLLRRQGIAWELYDRLHIALNVIRRMIETTSK